MIVITITPFDRKQKTYKGAYAYLKNIAYSNLAIRLFKTILIQKMRF